MAKFYFAEVRDIMDPLGSGRVKIRKYGYQNDEQNMKDDNLPWALPLQPITSAATNRVGVIPTGLIVGSRVIVHLYDQAYYVNNNEKKFSPNMVMGIVTEVLKSQKYIVVYTYPGSCTSHDFELTEKEKKLKAFVEGWLP